MKKNLLWAACLLQAWNAWAAPQQKDSLYQKEGFTLGVLPAIAFDADLGFQYGLLTNLYWYGDGSNFPNYNHSLYLEASRFNAGTTLVRGYYDAPNLIGRIRLTADLTWFKDLTLDFYGFNGYESRLHQALEDEHNPDYLTRVFYKQERNMWKGMVNLKSAFSDHSPWQWLAGVECFYLKMASVDIDRINKRGSQNPLPDVPTLFDLYQSWGIIAPEEADGGFHTNWRAGIAFDTRDKESFPSKGIWSELLFSYAPQWMSNSSADFGKVTLYHRQYVNIYRKKLIFAYRVGWQHRLWGTTPYYLLPQWNTTVLTSATSQGLGGGKTLRGIRRNRVVGDGSVMVNAEVRYHFLDFNWLRQHFGLGVNLFSDMGVVTQPYSVNLQTVPLPQKELHFNPQHDTPHWTLGAGIKASMNTNFILSVDYGRALDEQDGASGLYITMNYLF